MSKNAILDAMDFDFTKEEETAVAVGNEATDKSTKDIVDKTNAGIARLSKEDMEKLTADGEDDEEIVDEQEEVQEEVKEEKEEVQEEEQEEEVVENVSTEQEEESGDDFSFVPFLSDMGDKGILNFDDKDENFEDSEQGVEYVIEKTVESKMDEYKESLAPEVQELQEFIEAGGDPATFMSVKHNPLDYEKVDIEDNEDAQKAIVRDYLMIMGATAEEASDEIQDYIEGDILERKAQKVHPKLIAGQKAQKENLIKEQKAQQAKAREDYEKSLEDLKNNILGKKEILGSKVNKKTLEGVYNHMTKPINKKGETQLIANSRKDPDWNLKVAYLDYLGFSLEDLEKAVETKKTRGLKKTLSAYSDKNGSRKGAQTRKDTKGSNPLSGFGTLFN